jgi:hypothetical protein
MPLKNLLHASGTLCYICNILIYFCNIHMKHLQHTSGTSETLEAYACNMSVAILLGGGHHVRHIGGGAKSTTGLTATSFFYWGHRGVRSLDGSVKHGTAATPSRSPIAGGGDEEDAGAGSNDEGRGGWQA